MNTSSFSELGLPKPMLKTILELGYETPSPIQEKSIPFLLEGSDIIGQAQTGTGKTAAFALPLLTKINLETNAPQILVLTPTRELAIQVAESFQKYARSMKNFHVLPIYGGQAYSHQLRPLKKGVHVIVGTPGRVIDHIKRKTLQLKTLHSLVLDEADEMLRMGFIDDVNFILEQTPKDIQFALFSATMPKEIKAIANNYLNDPAEVKIQFEQTTAETVSQNYQIITGRKKIDALTRLLEIEDFDAMLVFVRTKNATTIVAEQLEARGFAATALNGDIPQHQREQAIQRLKKGRLDIIVATDVAARGLDVDRISHVVNYDAPTDPESYVHRIGRTGRAGKEGKAILFVTPREKNLLKMLGKATGATITPSKFASAAEVNAQRVEKFKTKIIDVIEKGDLSFNLRLIDNLLTENPQFDIAEAAAALAYLAQGEKSMLLNKGEQIKEEQFVEERSNKGKKNRAKKGSSKKVTPTTEKGMERFRIEVGHRDQVSPGAIVAAIAGASGLEGKHMGRIEIYQNFSTVDLPQGMPRDIFQTLLRAKINHRTLKISRVK